MTIPTWLSGLVSGAGQFAKGIGSNLLDFVWDEEDGVNWANVTPLLGAYMASRSDDSQGVRDFLGLNTPQPTGYMEGIPDYTYSRELVPNAFTGYERDNAGLLALDAGEANIPRRAGGAGRRYFTDGVFSPTVAAGTTEGGAEEGEDSNELAGSVCPPASLRAGETIPAGLTEDYCDSIHTANDSTVNSTTGETVVLSDGAITTTEGTGSEYTDLARGGLASLKSRGYYLGGRTDGMADRVPATIDQREPARLSDGEFVVPADVVSHLGNGSSNAGADQLFSMMDRVRKARTGRKSQGKKINPQRYLG